MTPELDYAALYQLARGLHALDLPELAQAGVEALGGLVGARYGLLVLFDGDDFGAWTYRAPDAPPRPAPLPWEALMDAGLGGFVYHSGRPVVIHNVAGDPRWPNIPNLPRMGSAVGMPLFAPTSAGGQGDCFGVLVLTHQALDYFNNGRIALLSEGVATASDALWRAFSNALLRRQAELRDGLVLAPIVTQEAPGAADQAAHDEREQLRADLTAMIYHDMRSPLQSIRLSLHRLAQMFPPTENASAATLLEMASRGTRQLRRMIDNLLDIEKLESSQVPLNTAKANIRALLAEVVAQIHPQISEAGMKLKFDVPGSVGDTLLDADMIGRVVANLLENAVKYTPDGGVIWLSARLEGDLVIVRVRDSGPGIPAEMQGRIFEKYSRVHYRNAPSGAGLGLTFCRLAVEAHHGRIWVNSAPGQGAEFIFTLPVRQSATDHDDDTAPVEAVALAG
jgi:signal transduction histidine kinase